MKAAERYPDVRRFVDEDLVTVDEELGGGALATVFAVTVRKRDASGVITGATEKKVLKVRVPNAEMKVEEIAKEALVVIQDLKMKAGAAGSKEYDIAKRMIRDIKEWVLSDINDTDFFELDAEYRKAHIGYTARNGIQVRVPSSYRPYNKDVKLEEFAEGVTLNKLLKQKLENRQPNLPGAAFGEALRLATEALIEDYARHLVQPVMQKNGEDLYLLHSDVHFGNAILSPDQKTVYSIDRNYYLQMDKKDVDLVIRLITMEDKDGAAVLKETVDYFLNLDENKSALSIGGLRSLELMRRIGQKTEGSQDKDKLSIIMAIFRELEAANIKIPIRMRIMVKNLISIDDMLRLSGAGKFSDYVKFAVNKYSAAPMPVSERVKQVTAQGGQAKTASMLEQDEARAVIFETMKDAYAPLKEKITEFLGRAGLNSAEVRDAAQLMEFVSGYYERMGLIYKNERMGPEDKDQPDKNK
ncbi:MAG: hypothetical protein HQL28_03355, partial [Candidatus Omnitrophica bacterium]|nr:hypothetical protein [Candidatus Omnitrophota bacterium]